MMHRCKELIRLVWFWPDHFFAQVFVRTEPWPAKLARGCSAHHLLDSGYRVSSCEFPPAKVVCSMLKAVKMYRKCLRWHQNVFTVAIFTLRVGGEQAANRKVLDWGMVNHNLRNQAFTGHGKARPLVPIFPGTDPLRQRLPLHPLKLKMSYRAPASSGYICHIRRDLLQYPPYQFGTRLLM